MHIASPIKKTRTWKYFRVSLGWIKPCGWLWKAVCTWSLPLFDSRGGSLRPPCFFILNCSKRNLIPRWFAMNANVVCGVSLSVPLLCCAQQVLPAVQLQWSRVINLTVVTLLHLKMAPWSLLTFTLIYFLPCESSVCKSWSSVLIGLLLPLRSCWISGKSSQCHKWKKYWSYVGDYLIRDKYHHVDLEF